MNTVPNIGMDVKSIIIHAGSSNPVAMNLVKHPEIPKVANTVKKETAAKVSPPNASNSLVAKTSPIAANSETPAAANTIVSAKVLPPAGLQIDATKKTMPVNVEPPKNIQTTATTANGTPSARTAATANVQFQSPQPPTNTLHIQTTTAIKTATNKAVAAVTSVSAPSDAQPFPKNDAPTTKSSNSNRNAGENRDDDEEGDDIVI
jgi:hypothetical protein